jgi:hypothetical protein
MNARLAPRLVTRLAPLLAPALLPLLIGGCSTAGSFQGKLVDGMSGTPRADIVVLGRAKDNADLACQIVEGKTDAAGVFTFAKTCKGATYTLEVKDKTMLLVDAPTVDGTLTSTAPVEIKAWRGPSSDGLSTLRDDKLGSIASRTLLRRDEKVKGTETVALFPKEKFKTSTAVTDGGYLVVAGKDLNGKLQMVPVVPSPGVVTFESGNTLENHAFIGLKFAADGLSAEPVTATLDESLVKTVKHGDRVLRYIPAAALPAGQYALFGEGDKEAFIVQLGAPAAEPTAAATPPATP